MTDVQSYAFGRGESQAPVMLSGLDRLGDKLGRRIRALIEKLQGEQTTGKGAALVQRLEKPVIGGVAFRGAQSDEITAKSLPHEASGDEVALAVFVIQHR